MKQKQIPTTERAEKALRLLKKHWAKTYGSADKPQIDKIEQNDLGIEINVSMPEEIAGSWTVDKNGNIYAVGRIRVAVYDKKTGEAKIVEIAVR